MNDEQSKRLGDAADAVLQAADAIDEARDAVADRRFDGDLERDRISASQQMAAKIENAAKRVEDAIRKGTIASAANGRAGAWARYRDALVAAREGRALGKAALDQDGSANKRARGEEALAKLDAALGSAAVIVFGE
jgi:hypothetical protein